MSELLNDFRFAARMFAKSPGTTAVAVLSLALAIGPNAALFSVIDHLLFKPYPIEGISRMYRFSTRTDSGYETPSYPDLLDYRAGTRDMADWIAADRELALLSLDGRREPTPISYVTENYFSVLGVRPAAGRILRESDDRFDGPPPVMLSDSLWQRKFGGAADIIGKTILLNSGTFSVAGIAPRGFRGPGLQVVPSDIWIPIGAADVCAPGMRAALMRRGYIRPDSTVRLREGVSKTAAEAAFTAITGQLARQYPLVVKGKTAILSPMQDRVMDVLGLMALSLVSLVLFVACANLAGVFLAQGEARRREFAVRQALGARRARLVRQLLAESLLLSLVGAGVGLLFSLWLMAALPAIAPTLPVSVSFGIETGVDGRVLAYTLLLSLATALAAGMAPALRASRPDLVPALKGDAPGGRSRLRLRGVLVVAQIAVCQFLLAGAALLTRSYFEMQQIRPGFDPSRKLLMATLIPSEHAPSLDYGQLAEKMAAVPGVRRVTYAKTVPLSGIGGGSRQDVMVPGLTPESIPVGWNAVGPGYFAVTGAHLLRGRDFEKHDARGAAIVNETMARSIWGSADAAPGKYFRRTTAGLTGGLDCQVIGVVEDGKYNSLLEAPAPYMFLAASGAGGGDATLLIETAGDPAAMAPEIRKALLAAEPGSTVAGLITMREQMRLAMWAPQTAAGVIGAIAALGIFLAGVGLYGLVSHSVNRRVHEIGVRMALGARPVDVVRLVLRQSLALVAVGITIGLAAAFAAARLVSALLYRVSPADPAALAAGVAVVIVVTLAAAHLPTRRAMAVDPMTALRNE